eukprot:13474128-Heterocapsa_arctica.AAC.1
MEYRGKITPVIRQGNLYYLPVRGGKSGLEEILVVQLRKKLDEINTIRGAVRVEGEAEGARGEASEVLGERPTA